MRSIFRLQKSMVHIAIALNIYNFASSLVGVFIPLVIFKAGGRLWEVAAFYLCYAVFKLSVNYPVVLIIQKKGARFGLGWGFIAGGCQMLSILGFAATHTTTLLVLGAASLSLTNAFLWNSQHFFISTVMSEDTKSSNIATISILGQLSSTLAPLLGGVVGFYLGSGYLLALAVLLCLGSLVPLRSMEVIDGIKTEKLRYDFSGAPMRDVLANFSYNVETAISVMVWPIYLAVFIANFRGIGTITTIATAVAILVTWMAGHRGDKGQDRAVLIEGVAITSMIDIARIVISSQLWIAIITSAYKASLAYFQNAWASTYYHHAKQKGLQYIMSMEIASDLAYVAVWGTLLLVLILTFSARAFFVVAFAVAAVFAWGCLLIARQKNYR